MIFFFFNDTATTEIYTLSLHDALPISQGLGDRARDRPGQHGTQGHSQCGQAAEQVQRQVRSEEHTSELQSHSDLVCRLLLEKKKTGLRRQTSWRKRSADTSCNSSSTST